jgi:hypothetical protein
MRKYMCSSHADESEDHVAVDPVGVYPWCSRGVIRDDTRMGVADRRCAESFGPRERIVELPEGKR